MPVATKNILKSLQPKTENMFSNEKNTVPLKAKIQCYTKNGKIATKSIPDKCILDPICQSVQSQDYPSVVGENSAPHKKDISTS